MLSFKCFCWATLRINVHLASIRRLFISPLANWMFLYCIVSPLEILLNVIVDYWRSLLQTAGFVVSFRLLRIMECFRLLWLLMKIKIARPDLCFSMRVVTSNLVKCRNLESLRDLVTSYMHICVDKWIQSCFLWPLSPVTVNTAVFNWSVFSQNCVHVNKLQFCDYFDAQAATNRYICNNRVS